MTAPSPTTTQAIRLDPKYAQAYINRGVANLYAGGLPKALADLINLASSIPNTPTRRSGSILWTRAAICRAGSP